MEPLQEYITDACQFLDEKDPFQVLDEVPSAPDPTQILLVALMLQINDAVEELANAKL